METCQSGRLGLTANELTVETRFAGANPTASAKKYRRRLPCITTIDYSGVAEMVKAADC